LSVPKTGASEEEWGVYFAALAQLGKEQQIDLFVVPPEDSLANGVRDYLTGRGFAVFGPSKAATEVEASKIWAYEFMNRHGIPTPRSWVCTSFDNAKRALAQANPPYVVKADGLAAGKGVRITSDLTAAVNDLRELMVDGVLGEAGRRVLIQEHLVGREVSLQAFSNGSDFLHLPTSCDYKRLNGLNTGGVGVYSPAVWLGESATQSLQIQFTASLIDWMKLEGREFRGAIYPGLMVTGSGAVALEVNARLGDPETQVLLPRMTEGDLLAIMVSCAKGEEIFNLPFAWDNRVCVGVVLCSRGYPGTYQSGFPIHGLDSLPKDVFLFHAGTKVAEDGQIVTNGGRVLLVGALGENLAAARERVYEAVEVIDFEGKTYRDDIAQDVLT
jgi:phosphoribosylamine--glycine ligase